MYFTTGVLFLNTFNKPFYKKKNRSQLKNVSGGQRTKKPKPQDPPQHVKHRNCFEPLRHKDSVKDSTPFSNSDKSFRTLLLGDSMIKQMQGQRLNKESWPSCGCQIFPWRNYQWYEALPNAFCWQEPSTDYSPCRNEQPTWPYSNHGSWEHCRPSQENWNENTEVILLELLSISDNVPNYVVKAVNKSLMKYCNQMTGEWLGIKTSTEIF